MQTFAGTLQSTARGETPLNVSFQIDANRVRLWSDRHRIGSWNVEQVKVNRESIFRFLLTVDDEHYMFSPQDPSGFASALDVEIDLTAAERPRFGLADRIRRAAGIN